MIDEDKELRDEIDRLTRVISEQPLCTITRSITRDVSGDIINLVITKDSKTILNLGIHGRFYIPPVRDCLLKALKVINDESCTIN